MADFKMNEAMGAAVTNLELTKRAKTVTDGEGNEKERVVYKGSLKQADYETAMKEEGVPLSVIKDVNTAHYNVVNSLSQSLGSKIDDPNASAYEIKLPVARGISETVSIKPQTQVKNPQTGELCQHHGQIGIRRKYTKAAIFNEAVSDAVSAGCKKVCG